MLLGACTKVTTKSPVLSFQLPRLLCRLKLTLRVLKLYYKVASSQLPAPQIAPRLKLHHNVASSQLPAPQMLCLPRNLHMEVYKVRLARNLHMEGHKVLCLPRNLHREVHKVLRVPRNLHMAWRRLGTCARPAGFACCVPGHLRVRRLLIAERSDVRVSAGNRRQICGRRSTL